MSTSISSASGRTATVAVLVWMRPWASVAGTRWTRWAPLSCLGRGGGARAGGRRLLEVRLRVRDLGLDTLAGAEQRNVLLDGGALFRKGLEALVVGHEI